MKQTPLANFILCVRARDLCAASDAVPVTDCARAPAPPASSCVGETTAVLAPAPAIAPVLPAPLSGARARLCLRVYSHGTALGPVIALESLRDGDGTVKLCDQHDYDYHHRETRDFSFHYQFSSLPINAWPPESLSLNGRENAYRAATAPAASGVINFCARSMKGCG